MNEKRFKKYLEKTADKLYKKAIRFFEKYPEYDSTQNGKGYLSMCVFGHSISVSNNTHATKKIKILKVLRDGQMERICMEDEDGTEKTS